MAGKIRKSNLHNDVKTMVTDMISEQALDSANFDSVLASKTTDDITEGSTNQYYTSTRADSDFDIRLATKTTGDISEGSNLYYTTSRADSDFDIRLATKTTDNLTEGSNQYYTDARADARIAAASLTDISDADQTVRTTDNVTFADLTLTGSLIGPSTMYVDPAPVDSDAGLLVIRGDLQVDGTTTTVNSTTVSINDKNIVLADSAANASEADGAGITVNGASATITYDASNDEWDFNKDINVTGTVTADGLTVDGQIRSNVTGGSLYTSTAGGIPRLFLGGGSGFGINRQSSSEDIFFGEPGDTGTWRVRGAGTISLGVGNSATSMVVQGNGGNVGIGTASPAAKLDVKSQINVTNAENESLQAIKGSRFGYSAGYKTVVLGPTGTTTSDNIAIGYDPSGNASGQFTGYGKEIIFKNGVEFMTPNDSDNSFYNNVLVMKDGKVGIGTADPSTKLHIETNQSGVTTELKLKNRQNNRETRVGFYDENDTRQLDIEYDNGSNRSWLRTNGNGFTFYSNQTSSQIMRIGLPGGSNYNDVEFSGNVGIGTNSPVNNEWSTGSKFLTLDATSSTAYGVLSLKGDRNNTGSTKGFNIGAGDGKLYLAYDDVNNAHRIVVFDDGDIGFGDDATAATGGNYGRNIHLHSTGTGASLKLTDNSTGAQTGSGFEFITTNLHGYIWNREVANVVIGASNTERFRMVADGRSAFGMDAPGTNNVLTISNVGNGATYPAIALGSATTGSGNGEGVWIGMLETGRGYLWNYEADDLWFGTNSTERMVIKSNGNIGIGTNSPDQKLDIVDTNNPNIRIRRNYSLVNGNHIGYQDYYGNSVLYGYHGYWVENASTNASQFRLYTGSGGSVTQRLLVTSTGRVNIGDQSTPTEGLEVYGTSGRDNMALKYSGTAGGHQSGYLWKDFRGQTNAGIYNNLQDDGVGTAAAKMEFYTSHSGTLTKQMEIDRYGQITTPNQPMFRAYQTTDPTTEGYLTSGNSVSWTEQYDRNNDFSGGTFTAPVNGVYHFTCAWDDNGGNSGIDLYKNASTPVVRWEPDDPTGYGWQSRNWSTHIYLNASEYVQLYGRHVASSSNPFHMGGGYWGWFSGVLVG